MSTLFPSRRLRWAVPGGVAAAVAVASLTSSVTASASGRPKLPPRTAAQLLVDLQQADAPKLSGTVVESVHLGLPDLSAVSGASSNSSDLTMQNLVAGSHTLRVFYGGPTQQRVALLGQLSESDIVHNGTDLWTYSSTTRQVTHSVLPKAEADATSAGPSPVSGLTPMASAQKVLAAIDPSTSVNVDHPAYVAGRSAYQVVLAPKDARSLVGSVWIALDAKTKVPLRVQVFAKNATAPSIQVGFTDVSFAAPSASIFRFVPPAGIKPKEQAMPLLGDQLSPMHHDLATKPSDAKVLGSGWTAVLQLKGATDAGATGGGSSASATSLLDKIATPVPGGRLITSSLLSVLIADDGRVLVGAVSGADLQKVAASGHGL